MIAVITLLVLVSAPAFTQADGTPSCTTATNTQLRDQIGSTTSEDTWAACAARCKRSPPCTHWTWHDYSMGAYAKVCVILRKFGVAKAQSGMVSGPRDCQGKGDTCVQESTNFHISDPTKKVEANIKVNSWDKCSTRCSRTPGCKYWTWINDKGAQYSFICTIMSSYDYVTNENVAVSGPRGCQLGSIDSSEGGKPLSKLGECKKNSYLYYVPVGAMYVYNRNYEETDLTQEACARKCRSDTSINCRAYSFNSDAGKCVLSDKTDKDAQYEIKSDGRFVFCTIPDVDNGNSGTDNTGTDSSVTDDKGLCSRPLHIRNADILPLKGAINKNEQYTVICKVGYSLPGGTTPLLQCKADGTLTNTAIQCVDCPVNDWLPFESISDVLNGYNYRQGDPLENRDPGFRGRIFEARKKDYRGCDVNKLDRAITLDTLMTCATSLSAKVYKSYESLSTSLAEESSEGGGMQLGLPLDVTANVNIPVGSSGATVGGSVSTKIPPPFKTGWSESDSMKRARKFFSTTGGSIVISEATCNLKRARLSMSRVPLYSQGFKDAVKMLNDATKKDVNVQKSVFRMFVFDYGTHFFTNMVFGAKVGQVMQYSEEATSMLNDEALAGCSNKETSVFIGLGINSNSDGCDNSTKKMLNGMEGGTTTTNQITKGSKPTSFDKWSDQKFTPVPLHFQLAPIANLFSDRNLERQTGMQIDGLSLRQWFVPMFWKYCETMGIDCSDACDIAYCDECSEDLKTCMKCQQGASGDGTDKCTRVLCTRPVIEHAQFTPSISSYGLGQILNIACDSMYDLVGHPQQTCGGDGNWIGTTVCNRARFQCSNGRIIKDSMVCNGDNDCQDCSDETARGCTRTCRTELFNEENLRCNNGKLINYADGWCDGDNDCGDCTDESLDNCRLRCTKNQLRTGGNGDDACDNNNCFWGEGDCDIDSDCNGSLECGSDNCRYQTKTFRSQFHDDDDCCE